MHWKRFCLVSLSLAWMAFPARVRAQDPTSTPGYSTMDNLSGASTLTPGGGSNLSGAMTLAPGGGTYLLFNKQTGQAVGIPTGYSRIGVRHAIFEDGPNQVFGEAEFLITDTNRYGLNTGLGYRTMIDGAVWGVNGWYDTIQSSNAFTYQQAGVGFEYLSDTFDFRANGYIPFGNRENFLKVVDPGTTPIFVGHDFSTLGTALFQQALAGWDAEAGVPMPVINWLRAYAGVYYLTFKGDETWGVRSRLEGRVTQGANVWFQVSNDQQFGTNLNVGVDIRFDGRMPTRFGTPADAYARRYDQVRRQWQVQLGTNKGDYAVPLNDPITGEKIQVTWVNNTAGAGGDGTVENPYNVLPSNADSDYVLVKRGVGDTVGNIVLHDGQDIFGEGKQHYINTDRLGLAAIPDAYFDNSGSFPTLRAGNPNAPVITLADGNQVSAFNITGGNTAAIAGAGTDNFLVECVNVTSASGLSIVDGGGVGIVRDSTFVNTAPGGVGISITNTAGPALNLAIDNVDTSGGATGTSIRAQGAPVSVNLTNYTGTSHTNAGIVLDAVGSTLGANVTDVTLTNVGDGVRMNVSGGGAVTGNISQLTASGTGNLLEGNVNTGALNVTVVDSNLSGSTGGSGVSLNLTNATGVAYFDNLTADGNAVDGEQAVASGATDYRVEIHNSSLAGNTDDATDNNALAGANLTVIVDPTDLSGSGDNAVEFEVDGAGSHITKLYTDVNASNSGHDGVNGTVTNGGRADVVFTNSPATNSGHNGLNLIADNGSTIAGAFTNGSFSQSGNAGAHVESTNNSNVGLTFAQTPIANNGAKGFEYLVNGGSLLSATFTGSDLSNNPTNNVVGSVDGAGSRAILGFTNSNANSLAVNGGFASNVTNGGALFGTWNSSNVSGTQGDGVRVTGTGAGTQIGLAFNTSLIENNSGNGLIASLTGGNASSSLQIDLNDSTLINNGLDGLNVTLDGAGTRGVVNINSTPISSNNRDGFEYDVSGGAQFGALATGAGNSFANNGENGIDGFVTGAGSKASVTIDSANANGSGASGVLLVSQNQGQQQFSLSNSSVGGSGSHGIEALAATNGTLNLQLDNVVSLSNQRNGITVDAVTGGDVTGTISNSFFSSNGQSAPSSGVRLNVSGAGSTTNILFDDVVVNNNTLHGFQLNSSSGGSLTAKINSGANGPSTANNNLGDGIQLTANGAGTVANLLMFGDSTTNNNGGNGLTVAGLDAQQVAVQYTGSSNSNAGDGVHVSLTNVANAALEITSTNAGSMSNNGGDGIDISLTNTDLTDLTVDGTLVESLHIAGLTIANNGGDGITIQTNNSNLGDAVIENNTIQGNAGDGLAVNLSTGGNLSVLNNNVWTNGGFGIHVTQSSNLSTININDNSVVGNTLGNIIVDLSGTAQTELHINNNTVDGDGVQQADNFNTGLNFLGSTLNDGPGFIPPDTMGAVGQNHIVETLNGSFTIYDKTTGNLISRQTLDDFWLNSGIPTVLQGTTDPRIIFDPTVNRWFMTSLDITPSGVPGNHVLVAVSDSIDPTGTWSAFRFLADTSGTTFNDYDTLGIDGDSLTIATINFGTFSAQNLSVYSIPKADLISATPTIANLARIEQISLSTFNNGPIQPVVNLDPNSTTTALLAASDNGSNTISRSNVFATGSFAGLFGTTQIPVPFYTAPNVARQPAAPDLENDAARFGSAVVQVNGSLWAAHAVRGTNNNSAIRWYEIDATTNAVKQTGLIDVAISDFYYPSIAVNDQGAVVIGYSGSGPNQFVSSMASYGVTDAGTGVTTFSAPTVLAAGTANYNLTFGGGRNRWGDYSNTVVDPFDNNKFWTFQERVASANTWGVQITEIDYEHINAIPGTTTGDAIAVSVSDNAHLLDPSSINGNTVTGHGGDGIRVNLNDNGAIDNLTIDGNSVSNNTGNGIQVLNTGTPTIGKLSISDNDNIENNGGNGILVQLNNVQGLPQVHIDGNTVQNNTLGGILVNATNTPTGSIDVTNNVADSNQVGIVLNIDNTIPGLNPIDINVFGNRSTNNTGIGIDIDVNNVQSTLLNVSSNVIGSNGGDGLTINGNASPIQLLQVDDNRVLGNNGNEGVFLSFVDSPIDTLLFRRNTVGGALVDGVRKDLDNSPVGDVQIIGNNITVGGNSVVNGSVDDSLPLIRNGFNSNTLLGNDDGSTAFVPFGFTTDFFGQVFSGGFVNNNGNITFGGPLSTFTPFGLLNTSSQIIAPFFADVDTRGVAADVTYGTGTIAGHNAFGVNWIDVRHFSVNGTNNGLPTNTFQLILVDRSDVGAGDFDIEYNYGSILWEAGTASGGDQFGLGGTSATAGYSNGVNVSYEFPGSRVNGAFLDSGPSATSLIQNSINSSHAGRYQFFARNGNIGTGGGGAVAGDGFNLNITNGSDIGAMLIDQNQITGNGSIGIDLNVADSTLPTSVVISNNTISGQAVSAVSIDRPDTNGTAFGVDLVGNTLTNSLGNGVELILDSNAGPVTSSILNNTITGGAAEGIKLDLRESASLTVADFSGNTIEDNDSIGLRLDATDTAQFSLTGGVTGHNTFDGNVDAGLAVTMNGNATGQVNMGNSDFLNTANGGVPTMSGEGVHISLTDNAVLQNLVIGDAAPGLSHVNSNVGNGVQVFVDGFSQLTNPTIQNLIINDNEGDGINIERRGLGVIDNFVINGNSLDGNAGDGFDIQARAGNLTDEYTILNNSINDSAGRGIAFRVDGDADMSTQLNGNSITDNGGTGITVDSTTNAVTDTPTFTGNWLASTITGNGGHGVDINSPNHVIQIGDATAGFPDTIISNNTGNGVLIRSTGTLDIDNTQLNNNGGAGVLFNGGTNGSLTVDQSEISSNGANGVDLVMTGNTLSVTNSRIASNVGDGVRVQSRSGANNVTLTNNIMTLNTLDGLEIVNDTAGGLTAVVTNSDFTGNTGRGVAIFNRGNGQANITLDDNQVVSNLQEGVYVVNTADADQNTRAASTVAMENGGLVTANPDLIFSMNRNTVSANGLGSSFTATGLVMRVGTADGGLADFTNDGGFAATRAGVTATVRDNILQGNAGSDVFFQSFVSTLNPAASVGTWDNGTFALANYQTDPLARLDLIYGNNVADSTDATTIGAQYTNDEPIFKSRTIGQGPAGPFATANRARNAQRLADRDVALGGTVLAPTTPVVQPTYLFPGMGASTFRVRLEPGNVFGTGSGFQLDGTPFVDLTDYNGVGPIPELFGWGTLP